MKNQKESLFLSVFIMFLVCTISISYAEISYSPRQTRVEILSELITKPNRLTVRVGSNGCTSKNSFRIDVKKEDGLSNGSSHYALSIIRIQPDQCKAIISGGLWVTFNMEKDLGLSGNYTYSIANRIFQNEHLVINESKVKNYKYYLTFPKRYVQLKAGKYEEGRDPDNYLNVKLIGYVIDDLDGNGTDDAVAILESTPMGSGNFFELTTLVADTEDDFIRQTNSIILGDRIIIDSFSSKSGKIVLKMTVHGPDDPSCCPSKKIIGQFGLTDGKLVPIKFDQRL
jgi:hypothetical protein